MGQFGFVRSSLEEPVSGIRVERDPGSFVDPKHVFGRDEDKKTILEMLFNESSNVGSDVPGVISIIGVGGMGKTTLAQLIYNDEEVRRNFSNRWFACTYYGDDKEVLGKIFQSIYGGSYSNYSISQLQTKIRESVEGIKFLLVLDDVWDEDHSRWQHRMSLLHGGAKGSKIIVTTRSCSVAKAVDSFKTHTLQGLSEDDSWDLFKRVAFTPERENDPRWTTLGREIVKKCASVPLAIKSIGSLLRTKDTVLEWESIRDQVLSKLEDQRYYNSIMPVLQLSYDHLPLNLKHCFVYCSFFPKDFVFHVQKLVYLWIAQGYIRPNEGESVEVAGYSCFMSLLRRSFFQEAEKDGSGEIWCCKMHDVIHELAQYVAREEFVMLKASSRGDYHSTISTRHVGVDCGIVDAGEIPQKFNVNMRILRSLMLMKEEELSVSRVLDLPYRSCKFLRALILSGVGIENVPSSIGELKLLRYLELSGNRFKRLPNSLSNLSNLVAFDLYWCPELEALPNDFRKLISLKYLNIGKCERLNHMPPGFGELCWLRYLSDFKVGRTKAATASREADEGDKKFERSGLDALAGLGQLRGELRIYFERDIYVWDEDDECSWQLPASPDALYIWNYPGIRIPPWVSSDQASMHLPNLVHIKLINCRKVKYLPYFRCLPYLKILSMEGMWELEYMEGEINGVATGSVNDTALFFPCLEELALNGLSKLKGWTRGNYIAEASATPIVQQHQHLSFPILSRVGIHNCPELRSMPSSPRICELTVDNVRGEVVDDILSSRAPSSSSSPSSCLKKINISNCMGPISFQGVTLASLAAVDLSGCCWPIGLSSVALTSLEFLGIGGRIDDLKILQLASPLLRSVVVRDCSRLETVRVEEASALGLRIEFSCCSQLENLHFALPNAVTGLTIDNCPRLLLHKLDWDSLPNFKRFSFTQ